MKKIFILLIVGVVLLFGQSVLASSSVQHEIDWLRLGMGLFGGLALFLAGLEQLADGLKKAAGETMKIMLSKLTTNRVMGAVTGAFVTGILNSSSITTVLVVGFVTAGMMTLTQSVGVIMGANIGSTVTAQILAFNVAYYSLIPVAIGFFMIFSAKREKVKHYGMMLMGLGLVFYGMGLMSDGMKPLRDYQPFLELLQKMNEPFYGILAGAVFTGLVQSSAATVGIAIAMASEGFLSLPAGIALALGANIGTCVTALMAALGKPTEAVRAAVVHIGFNILGVILWFFFIDDLAAFFTHPSGPVGSLLSEQLQTGVPRQIANANTLFNIVNTMVFLPFAPLFAKVATLLVPDKKAPAAKITPLFLDDSALDVPTLALARARQELGRVCEITINMFEKFEQAFAVADLAAMKAVVKEDDKVDILERDIIAYLGLIRQKSLSEKESEEHRTLMSSVITLETLADVIEKDLVRLASKAHEVSYRSSPETVKIIRELYYRILHCLRMLAHVIRDQDMAAASRLLNEEEELREFHHDLIIRKSDRLGTVDADALKVARIEMSVADKLTRIYSLAKRITIENGGEPGEEKSLRMIGEQALAAEETIL